MSDQQPRHGDIVRVDGSTTRWRVVGTSRTLVTLEAVGSRHRHHAQRATVRVVEPHPGGPR